MSTNNNLSSRIFIPLRILLPKTFFVFSFDLKSVYHHVDIFPDHCKYLAFSWEFAPGLTTFLDLKHINLHVYKLKFKCKNLHTIKNTFAKDFFLFSLLI